MKAPVPNEPLSVVVAMTVERSDAVPYANPRTVGLAPPVAVMLPFKVAEVSETDDGVWVVTVGAETAADVVACGQTLYPPAFKV